MSAVAITAAMLLMVAKDQYTAAAIYMGILIYMGKNA